jgi:hypothetical protein
MLDMMDVCQRYLCRCRELEVTNKAVARKSETSYIEKTWKFLLYNFILEVLSRTAYSPSVDQTNSSADPKDLFLHANAVYIMYSPSPHTTTNLPFGLCLKVWNECQYKWLANANQLRKICITLSFNKKTNYWSSNI